MSSLKMTFSLTSLIFLIALGLVFAPTAVMAHDASQIGDPATTGPHTTHPVKEIIPAVTADPNTVPPTAARAVVNPHGAHPTVEISLEAGATVSADGMEAVVTSSAAVVTLVVQFNMPINATTTDGTAAAVASDLTASDALLVVNDFTVAIRDNSGASPLTGALITQATSLVSSGASTDQVELGTVVRTEPTAGSRFVVPLTIATDAIPNGTAGDDKEKLHLIIRVNEGAGYGLEKSLPLDDGFTNADVPGGESQASMVKTFTLVDMLAVTPDTTAPTVEITVADDLDDMGKAVFTLTFNEALASTGLGALTVSDIEITGGTAMAADLTSAGNVYTLKVTPTDPNASVMIALRADSITNAAGVVLVTMDAMGMAVASTMSTYDKTAPTIAVTSAAGTGTDDGKVIFTIDSDEALGMGADGLSIADLTVSNAPPLKVADLVEVEATTAAPLPAGVEERHMLTITPTDATMANMLDIAGGSVADASGNMADGVRHTYTPAAPSDGEVDTGPPVAAGQIGSKGYRVFVPTDHDASALPSGLATTTVADMPNLVDFFTTGGTIDVAVTGKTNHQVIITEIMVAEDIGKRGGIGTARPAASQWIELYNNTDAHINIADIKLTFKTGFPAAAAPTDATDRVSNTVSGSGWNLAATFVDAVSGQTSTANNVTTVTKMFKSLRRVHKDNKPLQDDGTVIQNGWLSGSWALTADRRVFLAGRIGTPGSENRPSVFEPAVYKAPSMSVTFNEIANLSDNSNEWIELKGPADYNLRHHTIKIVTGYDKATNTGTETLIHAFPTDNDDWKIPASGILLLTDKSPTENKLEADLEDGVEKPARYRIVTLGALPNSGDFLLVLRDKDGANILDVAGHLAGLGDDDPYTLMWPLAARVGAAKDGHISAKNKLAGGNVYKRQRAIQGYLSVKDNGDEPAYEASGFTGIGYDRVVSPANKEHHGTPGYANDVQIGAGAEATDNVVISEVMYGDGTGNLPQWIELQNRSHTNGVDLHNWKLYVVNHSMNADGSAFEGKLVDSFFLRGVKIPPRQTALVVSKAGQNKTNLPPHRVLNLKRKGKDALLSSKGFYLFLVANAHEGEFPKRQAGDTAGNLSAPAETVTGDHIKLFDDAISTLRAFDGMEPAWELPAGVNDNDYRVSIARKGSKLILNSDGTAKFYWVSSEDDKRSYNLGTSYGRQTDVGTPGNTPGAALPVSLSKFRPERLKDTGEIVIRWVTESELNNAGFNILRSETRNGEFTKINTSLIAGQGTTSERTAYEWKDSTAKPNVVYYYQIQDVSFDGDVTTLRQSRLKGNVTAAGKVTTTWGELKALQ